MCYLKPLFRRQTGAEQVIVLESAGRQQVATPRALRDRSQT